MPEGRAERDRDLRRDPRQRSTKADLQALEQRMLLRFTETDARIDPVVVRLGSLMVVLTGLLFAVLHYWPPHG
jgi:hypothetical protein